MKTIIEFRIIILILVSQVLLFPNQSNCQNRLWDSFLVDGRFYNIRDNNNNQVSLSGTGITFCHEIKEKIYKRKVVYNLIFPLQYVSNYQTGENKLDAYAIGTAFKFDIATLNADSKWFFTTGLGMEYYLFEKTDFNFNSGAILYQFGLRFRNTDALFKDFEFGFTASKFIYKNPNMDFASLVGLYARLNLF